MFFKWIAGLLVLGALTAQAQAEEKDAPLPFDEPAAAPQLVKKAAPAAPIKVSNQTLVRTSSKATSGKKMAAKPVAKRSTKISTKKIASSKTATQKPAVKKPAVKKPAVKKPAVKKPAVKMPVVSKKKKRR